jgi:acetoacetate decarboxylase
MTETLLTPPDLSADEAPYPPAPWTLRGEAVIVPVPVRVSAARRFIPGGVDIVSAGGRTMGGVLLARYDETATLAYHEIIVFAGTVKAGGKRGMWVSHIDVDLPASVAGGRRIWGLPKGLATFGWSGHDIVVKDMLSARIRRPPVALPMPLRPSTFGVRDGSLVWTASKGSIRGTMGLAKLEVPPSSPLAPLGLGGRWPALAGDRLELPFPEPQVLGPAP